MKGYIANVGSPEKLQLVYENKIGLVFSPFDFRRYFPYSHFLDNGAYTAYIKGHEFKEDKFMKFMEIMVYNNPDFIVIPDIVAGGLKSLEFSKTWLPRLPDNIKKYIAVQDGLDQSTLTNSGIMPRVQGLFVGGSKRWKYDNAEIWVKYAHSYDIPCHIGRYGTMDKWLHALTINADSWDSSNPCRHQYIFEQLIEFLDMTR